MSSVINAEVVQRRRRELSWSRARLARELGVSPSVAWRIEHVGPTRDELGRVAEVLGLTDGRTPADANGEDACEVLEEWRGLRRGDVCRLTRLDGRLIRRPFKFLQYRRTPGQESVELVGSRGERRTSRPELVRDERGRELPPPEVVEGESERDGA